MFIARQPIFTIAKDIYGYELLFRETSSSSRYTGSSSIASTAKVLGNLFEQGLEKIVGNQRAFVNFDYDFILSDTIELINPNRLIIEVLETVKIDQALIQRLEELKSKGFMIALDDFKVENSKHLLPLADIIKWDIIATPLESIDKLVLWALAENKIILAEKVETEDEFLKAKAMGFHLFQGFFFSKPKIVGSQGRVASPKAHYSLILNELKTDEPSFITISRIIETEVDLAYRLIKISSQNEKCEMISSISKALIRMGLKSLERWINILMLQDLSQGSPQELLKISLIRSKFAEFIAINTKLVSRRHEISMAGLFSMLDIMLDSTMEDLLDGLFVTDAIKNVLIYREGEFKPISNLIYYYEKADWEKVNAYSTQIGIDENSLSKGYLDSLEWASNVINSLY